MGRDCLRGGVLRMRETEGMRRELMSLVLRVYCLCCCDVLLMVSIVVIRVQRPWLIYPTSGQDVLPQRV
jgi:hypothetical protein